MILRYFTPYRKIPFEVNAGFHPPAWEGVGMGSGGQRPGAGQALTLDNILSAMFYFTVEWTPALKRSQSRDLLRLLICKLYGVSRGYLFHATIRASQGGLASDLGISREWCNQLVGRLVAARWIRFTVSRLPDGTFEIGTFRPGRMLKRLLCMLLGYRKGRNRRVKSPSQELPPTKEERKKALTFLAELQAELASKLGLNAHRQR